MLLFNFYKPAMKRLTIWGYDTLHGFFLLILGFTPGSFTPFLRSFATMLGENTMVGIISTLLTTTTNAIYLFIFSGCFPPFEFVIITIIGIILSMWKGSGGGGGGEQFAESILFHIWSFTMFR